jgi:predicted dehydrogenase
LNGTAHSPAKVALIGCGAVSHLYYGPALDVLQKQGVLEVTSLLDPDADSIAPLNKLFPLARTLHSVADAARSGAELAIIASPPALHARQSIEALHAGMGVLCEKPMATSAAEAQAMIDAASTTRRVLAIGLVRRFFPATQFVRDVLSHGWLGEVTSFHCFEGGKFDWPVRSTRYFTDAPGGVLLDIGSHTLDLLSWWFGETESIEYEDDAMGGIEVNCRIHLRFHSGAKGQVRLSRDWPQPNRYTIRGTKGWLRWDVNEANSLHLGITTSPYAVQGRLNVITAQPGTSKDQIAPDFHQSFLNQLRNVSAAVRGQEPVRVPGEAGLRCLRIIERCYHHRTPMQLPWLNPAERDQAARLTKGAQ